MLKLAFRFAEFASERSIDGMLTTLLESCTQLPHLRELIVHDYSEEESRVAEQSQLAALTRMPLLRRLALHGVHFAPADTILLSQLAHLDSLHVSDERARTILAGGHRLQRLQELRGVLLAGQADADALASLPSLTLLEVKALCNADSSLDFLLSMPQLRTLRVTFSTDNGVLINEGNAHAVATFNLERVIAALQSCTQLTELRVDNSSPAFRPTVQQLSACLQHMPQLRSLHLSGVRKLRSLVFLAQDSLARSLRKLCLDTFHPRLPQSAQVHAYALAYLEELQLDNVFQEGFDPAPYQLPSAIFPRLVTFTHHHR
jgi:hypothetical protein